MRSIKRNSWLIAIIVFFTFAYIGIFTRYRIVPSYLLVFALAMNLLYHKTLLSINKTNVTLWILLVYVTLSALLKNLKNGFEYVVLLLIGVLLLAVDFRKKDCLRMIKSIEICALLFALFTFANLINKELIEKMFRFLLSDQQVRNIRSNLLYGGIPGLAGEVSYNGFCLMIGIVCVFARVSYTQKIKLINALEIAMFFVAIFLTQKRALMLAVMLMIAYVFWIYAKNSGNKTIKKYIFITMVVFGLLLCIPILVKYVISELLFKGAGSLQLSNREWFWNMAIEMFRENPLFGGGINTYDFLYNERKTGIGYVYYAGAHNSYLQYLAELGIVGLLILLIMIVYNLVVTFRQLKSNKRSTLTYYSLFAQLSIIVYAFSENPFYQPQQIVCYFMAVAMLRAVEREQHALRVQRRLNITGIKENMT